jgi:hypothetical protein
MLVETISRPSYLDIKLLRLRHGAVCACGTRLSCGDRGAWAGARKEMLCIPCVKLALATSVIECR